MDIRQESLAKHYEWAGKIEVTARTHAKSRKELSLAYTPGVAEPCVVIQKNPEEVWKLTRRWNTVAVITDGTAVLGLGDIGPEAGMPVMEGKCLLFKEFAGIDAIPLCIRSKDPDEIVNTVRLLCGSFGGVNLEDISAPRCFEIERRLRECCDIPVFHDDQHGTAIIVSAAMLNACRVVKKDISEISVVINGAGAAGLSIGKMLRRIGVTDLTYVDKNGVLYEGREDMNPAQAAEVVGKGLAASPGSACGQIVFTAEEAEEMVKSGKMKKVVLVRLETSPEDIVGMQVSQGILTVRGGMTSHAAVVARGMGTCCVSGCGNDNEVKIDEEAKTFEINGHKFVEGDWISIDGSTGNIYDGIIPTVDASIAGEFGRIMGWADKYRTLKVRTNADTPRDAAKAVELGAEGIGLCRTEHMFFEADRIAAFREMICSDTVEEREEALEKILPYQQGDFEKLYETLEGKPVTIRFLDPPLHEFVPTEEADIEALAAAKHKSVEDIKAIIASLHEFNPMMGHRGCRLAVTYPEIAKMQTAAVIRAAINVQKKHPDWKIVPEIMIPLVGDVKEFKFVKKIVVEVADAEIKAAGIDLEYEVGTMIEIPRAALTADEIAAEADFFCFGTNDLTQMTFGFSRDDAGKFLNAYYDTKIFENDPFAKLDQNGVGKLMQMTISLSKPVNPKLHCGICGEHGGDPSSVEFCNDIGLDYVSCSPFRVPIARLSAAQAAIKKHNA